MLHDLNPVPVRDVRNNIDQACKTGQCCQGFGREMVDPAVMARAAAHAVGRFFDCEKDVLATMAQDGKMYIGPSIVVASAASNLAARHDVLVLAQR